jgi:hypothetical protein
MGVIRLNSQCFGIMSCEILRVLLATLRLMGYHANLEMNIAVHIDMNIDKLNMH